MVMMMGVCVFLYFTFYRVRYVRGDVTPIYRALNEEKTNHEAYRL
jgi:hypothetical protein